MDDIIVLDDSDNENEETKIQKKMNLQQQPKIAIPMMQKRHSFDDTGQQRKRIKTNHVTRQVSAEVFQAYQQQLSVRPTESLLRQTLIKTPPSPAASKPTTSLQREVRKDAETLMEYVPAKNKVIYKDTETGVELLLTNRRRNEDDPLAVPRQIIPQLPEVEIKKISVGSIMQNPRIIRSPKPGSSRGSTTSSPGVSSDLGVTPLSNGAPSSIGKPVSPPEMNSTYKSLLEACKSAEQSKEMDLITSKLVKYYNMAPIDFVNSKSFIKSVDKVIADIIEQPDQVFYLLKSIFEELKVRQKQVAHDGTLDEAEFELTGDPKQDAKLKKLNKALLVCQKKIDLLRQKDTNWDAEHNSTYLVIDKYEKRALRIFDKICEITGEDNSANRKVKKPIRFKDTEFPEFNRTLQSFYNRTKKFPDYLDVLKIMEHCNTSFGYELGKEELKRVAQTAFQSLGQILQARRKLEEYEMVNYYSDLLNKDPALSDPDLARKLDENQKYHTRMDDVIRRFAEGRHLSPVPESSKNETKSRTKKKANGHDSDSGTESTGSTKKKRIKENDSTPPSNENCVNPELVDEEPPNLILAVEEEIQFAALEITSENNQDDVENTAAINPKTTSNQSSVIVSNNNKSKTNETMIKEVPRSNIKAEPELNLEDDVSDSSDIFS